MTRLQTCGVAVAAFALVLNIGTALAQEPVSLDTPTISVRDRGFFRIALDVQAGPSGAPAGFTIEWMKKSDYDAGGWPSDPNAVNREHCVFDGDPTLNGTPDFLSFRLAPNGGTFVELGDLFDETGVAATYSDHLLTNTSFAIRVIADGDADHSASAYSPTLFSSTTNAECTQGFWQNHEEVWPVGCMPMMLGNVLYTKAQLLAIYYAPANGNGLISLAHQLITTKLNACNGSNTTSIAAFIAAADAQIGNLVVPPIGSGFIDPSQTEANTEALDDYNNGHKYSGVVNCPTPVIPSTWGVIKSLYH